MRVLHISHNGLPDPRVERNAMIAKERGHEVCFLGGGNVDWRKTYKGHTFFKVEKAVYKSDATMLIGVLDWYVKIWKFEPDVIHAHDILAARMTFNLGYPVIYDDHEWWTLNFPIWYRMRNTIRKFMSCYTLSRVPRWEARAASSYPVLTVSHGIAEHHKRKYGARVWVTHNYPSLHDVENVTPEKQKRSGIVYVGSDVVNRLMATQYAPYRDPSGLPESVKFDRIYGLPYRKLLSRLMTYEVGIVPWSPHWIHKYASTSKLYDYLHAGLQIVAPKTMVELQGVPYAHFFEQIEDVPSVLEEIEPIDPTEIMEYARTRFVWEAQEGEILRAYAAAGRSL